MSNAEYLHSHSALEREHKYKKHIVLVDIKYLPLFSVREVRKVKYGNIQYIAVPILKFVKCGGVFRNFDK